ncbi:spermine oxidase-like [Diabrotica virgifera virgifera]|uniref:Amine oxidase domain-containing protein n=1 Tax=Diabrotica virgifera virgifera TaxID=50390 RepID=A0ABM5JRP6_DIAVI|nr:spermine oxidase-like [Diabrotica virgifera virgifera]
MHLFLPIIIVVCTLINIVTCAEQTKVIIVGSGPAGIAAASKLLENGIEDILILEAENRVGGRIDTEKWNGRNIDLGAEWCHGEKNNSVWEILEQKGLLNLLEREDLSGDMFLSSRKNISKEFSNELSDLVLLYYQINENVTQTNVSLGEIMVPSFYKEIQRKFGNDKEKYDIAKSMLDWLENMVLGVEGAFSWNDASYLSQYTDCEGDLHWGWGNRGYKIFLDVLTKKYPNPKEQLPIVNRILLNKEVKQIITNDSGNKLICTDGTSYEAKHVIFTPSLGVLKHDAKSIFTPKLADEKLEAIDKIGFGALIKVFVKYDRIWWGNATGMNLIWTEEDRKAATETFSQQPRNSKSQSWVVEMHNVFVLPHSSILLVWFTGELVPTIEKMDDATLQRGIDFTFLKFFGHIVDVAKSQQILKTTWYTNPHFRGTYSFASVNSTVHDVEILQQPITNSVGVPTLQFAGEATHRIYHSTVHGAVESGFREANRIIQHYKKS